MSTTLITMRQKCSAILFYFQRIIAYLSFAIATVLFLFVAISSSNLTVINIYKMFLFFMGF